MATVQAPVSTQARPARASAPPGMYTRPWRSSPLAGPGFSTLPPIISESSEETESREQDLSAPESLRDFERTRSQSSSSIVSHASVSANASASASASALPLFESEASKSSVSLSPSTSVHGTTSSSHGHGNTKQPGRSSKSWARRPSSAHAEAPPRRVAEAFIAPLPRARTVSHNLPRPTSYAGPTFVPSPTMPATYSPNSPPSQSNTPKQPPSVSRDPTSNWMSSSPFGPAQTPKFSRLAMASPAVVMPLSAREYRKQKTKEPHGKTKENDTPSSTNTVSFVDAAISAFKGPKDVPTVRISPPEGHQPHHPPLSSSSNGPDPRSPPDPHVDHLPKPFPQSAQSRARYSHPRSRSRPTTPPKSSPLAGPPLSPKSSAGTFFSVASSSDGDPPFLPNPHGPDPPTLVSADNPDASAAVSPRLRLRRKSYPDRLSDSHRLSLTEAMNRLSGHSQIDGVNRLSVLSQASSHTLFYDVNSEDGHVDLSRHGSRKSGARTPVLHTQSLEDLSSSLTRTGIEVVNRDGAVDDVPKGKRNVRMVRISDTVEVSPAPTHRRRKLTKSRPEVIRVSAVNEQGQPPERRVSLLPWKSRGSSGGVANAGPLMVPVNTVSPQEATARTSIPISLIPGRNPSLHAAAQSKLKPDDTVIKKPEAITSASPEPSPRKTRRYTFSFLSSPTFPLSRRRKSGTLSTIVDLSLDNNNAISKGSPTDGTSTSIRTVTQGTDSTLTLASQGVYDLTTLASSGGPSGRGMGASTVPMLRRLNAQETEMADTDRSQSLWEGRGGSTPSLITNSSTVTASSIPPTPLRTRQPGSGGEPFVPRPSGLKESFTDTSEEDSEGVQGRGEMPRTCVHRKLDPSPLARGAGVVESEGEDMRARSKAGLLTPSPGRPGTPNSMLTTVTETSVSYASFSTVPATSTSSSVTSRSTSPSLSPPPLMRGKREWAPVQDGEGGDSDGNACALCGHVASRSTSPVSLREAVHPMFTVPLVTVPASTAPLARAATLASAHAQRGSGGGHTAQKYPHSPVPVVAPVSVGLKNDHGPVTTTGHGVMTDTMSPPKVRKRRRPQTAPAGTGDVALKFIEPVQSKVDVGGDCPTKPKAGQGQSRFKTVLKSLLKWSI